MLHLHLIKMRFYMMFENIRHPRFTCNTFFFCKTRNIVSLIGLQILIITTFDGGI